MPTSVAEWGASLRRGNGGGSACDVWEMLHCRTQAREAGAHVCGQAGRQPGSVEVGRPCLSTEPLPGFRGTPTLQLQVPTDNDDMAASCLAG